MLRWGLCCMFREVPIKFATTTATSLARLSPTESREKLARLCHANALALRRAFEYCVLHGIGCFRVNSEILPIKTHPTQGYEMTDLPGSAEIIGLFRDCGDYARQHDLRVCFHPSQFVVLNSLQPKVVAAAISDLEYHGEVAEWVQADVINIHGGGAFGDKSAALKRFAANLEQVSPRVRSRLTVENDDKIFSPADLLPLCQRTGIPLVYDVHHHRCLADGLSVAEATQAALATWNREPLFHLSSPLEGWTGPQPERHHDFIDPADFPDEWSKLSITVEVEAKAKELAVRDIRAAMGLMTLEVD